MVSVRPPAPLSAPWRYPTLIAHRCGGVHGPENTLAGLDAAARLGFGMVEFDVMLAGCGTPVLIHDETLERTTNGVGRVSEQPYEALRELDAGVKTSSQFAGERIPTFEEALVRSRVLKLMVNVEIKPATGFERSTAQAVATMVRDVACGGVAPLLSSFSCEALEVARDIAPEVPRGLLFEEVPADWRAQFEALQAVSVHCDAARLAPEQLAELRAAGVPVVCYTVNDAAQARALFQAGVSGVFTDRLLPGAV